MTAFANSLSTNILVTALVMVMVFLMPWADRKLCRKLDLNLQGGVSGNSQAERLLRLRRGILLGIFWFYMLAMAYIVFFSRAVTQDHQVHVAPFEDLLNSGFTGLIRAIFTEGFHEAFARVDVVSWANVAQVYMNVMLFVPMGYLLPYVFGWFRVKVRYRPALACFLFSVLIENLQLIFRRGFYDMDDLLSNAIGGLIGQWLFIAVAYVVTTPNWRRELKSYRRWRRHARTRTLYPFAHSMDLSRTTLVASSEESVWDFYIMKLGFRLVKQIVPLDSPGTDLLLRMGQLEVEIHCLNRPAEIPPQTLALSVSKLTPVVRRLKQNGVTVGEIGQDIYTGQRCVGFDGPDGVRILVIEM